jgi:hypothetical protein
MCAGAVCTSLPVSGAEQANWSAIVVGKGRLSGGVCPENSRERERERETGTEPAYTRDRETEKLLACVAFSTWKQVHLCHTTER